MSNYQTKQRRALMAYLEENTDRPLSIASISEALASENISLSAIYRNLAAMETEGKVRKITKTGAREVYYQYVDAEICRGHLHLACEKCGKTYHASGAGARALAKILSTSDGFALDQGETVLYGICKSCRKEEEPTV